MKLERSVLRLLKARRKHHLHREIRENVEVGAELHTDALSSNDDLNEYTHKVVDHAEAYVDGTVHTNRLENFWSLLKRSIKDMLGSIAGKRLTYARVTW